MLALKECQYHESDGF